MKALHDYQIIKLISKGLFGLFSTTSNIIYLISCRITLKKRFYGHRSTVKTHNLTLLWANTSIYLITPFLT